MSDEDKKTSNRMGFTELAGGAVVGVDLGDGEALGAKVAGEADEGGVLAEVGILDADGGVAGRVAQSVELAVGAVCPELLNGGGCDAEAGGEEFGKAGVHATGAQRVS